MIKIKMDRKNKSKTKRLHKSLRGRESLLKLRVQKNKILKIQFQLKGFEILDLRIHLPIEPNDQDCMDIPSLGGKDRALSGSNLRVQRTRLRFLSTLN